MGAGGWGGWGGQGGGGRVVVGSSHHAKQADRQRRGRNVAGALARRAASPPRRGVPSARTCMDMLPPANATSRRHWGPRKESSPEATCVGGGGGGRQAGRQGSRGVRVCPHRARALAGRFGHKPPPLPPSPPPPTKKERKKARMQANPPAGGHGRLGAQAPSQCPAPPCTCQPAPAAAWSSLHQHQQQSVSVCVWCGACVCARFLCGGRVGGSTARDGRAHAPRLRAHPRRWRRTAGSASRAAAPA